MPQPWVRWRERARELRAIAQDLEHGAERDALLNSARSYEEMAQKAEEREAEERATERTIE